MAQQLTFVPPPQELPYYDGLFQVADYARAGALGGKEAVGFLSRSKLPVELLRNIWTMADNPKSNSLDRGKFHVAIRLIQLYQNGQKAQDAHLSTAPGVAMRPAYFEGVSGVSVPMPGQQGGGPPATPAAMTAPPSPGPQQQQQQQQHLAPPTPISPPRQQRLSYASQQQHQQHQQQQQHQQHQHQQHHPPPYVPHSPGQTLALVPQDPYAMQPHEQSRYESLFPQYETRKDGFIYGAEAVALFSKSGLGREQLRDIWNMADDPVDNRLDKLEFAIAMHLIVCISKKNLPVPPSLPPSLKSMKDRASGGGGGGQQQQQYQQQQYQQQQHHSPLPSVSSVPQVPSLGSMSQPMAQQPPVSIPSPSLAPQPSQAMQPTASPVHQRQSMSQQPGMAMAYGQPAQGGMMGYGAPQQHIEMNVGPPPLTSMGGMSISDAFEGLNPESPASYDSPPSPSPAAGGFGMGGGGGGGGSGGISSPQVGGGHGGENGFGHIPEISIGGGGQRAEEGTNYSASLSMRRPSSPPKPESEESGSAARRSSNKPTSAGWAHLSKSYKMEDDNGELVKLQAALQKLQAENISLKAKLGDVSEEEKDVRKEINATIAEIGKLSQELTGLREMVAYAKASLIEATAELKAQHEKKEMMKDLIYDAGQTLSALDAAHESIRELKDSAAAVEEKKAAASAAGTAFESDLFGFDSPTPAPGPTTSAASVPADDSSAEQEDTAPNPVLAPEPDLHHEDKSEDEPYRFSNAPAPVAPDVPMDVMGGNAHPYHHEEPAHSYPTSAPMGGAPLIGATSSLNADAFGHGALTPDRQPARSAEEIETLKLQAANMDEIAREAEVAQRELSEKVDNLRKIAEQAEAEAKEKMVQVSEKKKKKFGSGAKKAMKEAELAEKDAAEKRKHAVDAQTELSNAQAQAIKAKRVADDYRQQAEQAEILAASALSVVSQVADERKRAEEVSTAGPASSHAQPAVNAGMEFSSYEAKGMGAPGGMGMSMGGGGGMMMGGGIMGGLNTVMSGGGSSGGIPSPSGSENGDAYSNPFGGF